MRKLLVTILIAFSFFAKAQQPRSYKWEAIDLFSGKPVVSSQPQIGKDSLIKLLNGYTIAKGSPAGVYQLPIDNMPCVVPDTKTITAMPNAWKGGITIPFSTRIPNPGKGQNLPRVQSIPLMRK